MAWYDLDEKPMSKKEYLAKVRYDEIICKKTSDFREIIGDKIDSGVQYRLVTENSFNAIVVLDYLLSINELEEVYIVIYRMNIQAVRKIKDLADIVRISVVVSSFFRENKKYERWVNDLFEFSLNNKNLTVVFAWNHAKICLIKTVNDDYIVFEGSGNLSDNARIEQYVIENNKQVYNFHKSWIKTLIEDGKK